MTQQDLSVVAEVSRKSINAIENGVYVPSTVLALKIARTLNCSVEDLFELPRVWIELVLRCAGCTAISTSLRRSTKDCLAARRSHDFQAGGGSAPSDVIALCLLWSILQP